MVEYLSDEDAFAELLARKSDKELLREQKRCEEELQKAMSWNLWRKLPSYRMCPICRRV